MYIYGNPKSKKALKELVTAGKAEAFAPGQGEIPVNGTVYLEGPHYPEPHRWYAEGTMKDGKLIKVK